MRRALVKPVLIGAALALAMIGLGLSIAVAISQGVWDKARVYAVALSLLSVGAFLVIIPNAWLLYTRQQSDILANFIVLSIITIAALSIAWRFLAQAARP